MAEKYKYKYLVPRMIKNDGVNSPRIPKHIGYRVIEYLKDNVLILVSRGGHNYLKNVSYAKRINEVYRVEDV